MPPYRPPVAGFGPIAPKVTGKEPSRSDLQKNADNAQKAANDTDSKYGNIKQQIIDLLKDFIGTTDIATCPTRAGPCTRP